MRHACILSGFNCVCFHQLAFDHLEARQRGNQTMPVHPLKISARTATTLAFLGAPMILLDT